jgi:hypothetical protein
MARIDVCIEDYDLEGQGETIEEALQMLANQCETTADKCAIEAERLREAAARYRAMREVKP